MLLKRKSTVCKKHSLHRCNIQRFESNSIIIHIIKQLKQTDVSPIENPVSQLKFPTLFIDLFHKNSFSMVRISCSFSSIICAICVTPKSTFETSSYTLSLFTFKCAYVHVITQMVECSARFFAFMQ